MSSRMKKSKQSPAPPAYHTGDFTMNNLTLCIIVTSILHLLVIAFANDDCQMYLAPSHLKNAASHGFGLGIFTGRHIHAGEILYEMNEILIPLYDSSTMDIKHPPLREYLWPITGTLPELGVHIKDRTKAFWFGGGISSMAPCTSLNFNVYNNAAGEWAGMPRWNLLEDPVVPSREDPRAGSYSYRHNLTYVAVRDIAPGEELVVSVQGLCCTTFAMCTRPSI